MAPILKKFCFVDVKHLRLLLEDLRIWMDVGECRRMYEMICRCRDVTLVHLVPGLGPLGLADLHLHCSAESLMPYSDCEAVPVVPVVLVAPYCHQVDQAHVEYGSVLQWKQSTPNVRQSALPSQAQKGRLQLSGKQLPLQCVPC